MSSYDQAEPGIDVIQTGCGGVNFSPFDDLMENILGHGRSPDLPHWQGLLLAYASDH